MAQINEHPLTLSCAIKTQFKLQKHPPCLFSLAVSLFYRARRERFKLTYYVLRFVFNMMKFPSPLFYNFLEITLCYYKMAALTKWPLGWLVRGSVEMLSVCVVYELL